MSHPSKHTLLKKLPFFTLFLLVGFFGVAEKGWGADGASCGDKYAGKQGVCKEVGNWNALNAVCPTGWYFYENIVTSGCNLMKTESCCIQSNTVCTKDGAECILEGEKGACENGSCIKGKAPYDDKKCGEGNLGVCLSNCQPGSPFDTPYADINGACKSPTGACCKKGATTTTTTCGDKANMGYCTVTSDCTSLGQKEDASGSSSCGTGKKCCYKSNANPDTTSLPRTSGGYQNPLTVNSFTALAEKILVSVQGIVGWLAVIMIMIGGIVYLTSAGTNQATLGKEIITAALIGFAVAVAGPSLLKEIKDVASSTNSTDAIDNAKDIKSIFTSVLNFLLTAMGTLALIGFAIGGFFYLTAFGDKGKADSGKKMVVNSLYAIALAGGGLILVNQILSLLGG